MGRDKAWLPFGGELMLPRLVRLVSAAVAPVVVVAAPGQELPDLPAQVTVVRDEVPGLGPLQGLLCGLRALLGKADAAYLSSCDVPLLRPAFVRRMIELLGDQGICVARAGGHDHPLAAVYRLEVAEPAGLLLTQGRRRLIDLFDLVPTRFVEAAELADVDPGLQSLRNLNTLAEYEQAVRELNAGP